MKKIDQKIDQKFDEIKSLINILINKSETSIAMKDKSLEKQDTKSDDSQPGIISVDNNNISYIGILNEQQINEPMKNNPDNNRKTEETQKQMKPLDEITIERIEDLSKLTFDEVIFECHFPESKEKNSLNEKIIGRQNLVFLIEDESQNIFGGFVSSKIDKTIEYISDENAFVFSLKSNGRIDDPKKFDISVEHTEEVFRLGSQETDYYFEFGNRDILVKKQEDSENESNQSRHFNYTDYDDEFILTGNREFKIKTLRILQMKE